MTPRAITFISSSQGSGTTTACANLAVLLAHTELRVLVVDLDPQAHATQLLGAVPEAKRSTGAVLAGRQTLAGIVEHSRVPYLYLAAATPEAPVPAISPGRAFDRLDFERLADHAPEFSFILVDTPSSDELLPWLSLFLCDEAILPIKPTLKALYAAVPTMEMILQARERRETDLPAFLGFLPMAVSREREMVPCAQAARALPALSVARPAVPRAEAAAPRHAPRAPPDRAGQPPPPGRGRFPPGRARDRYGPRGGSPGGPVVRQPAAVDDAPPPPAASKAHLLTSERDSVCL